MRLVALSFFLAPPAAAATWEVDTAHSEVGFVAKHLFVAKVRGEFKEYSGTVVLDDKDVTKSSVDVKIKAASIDTDNQKRDDHLRSKDFFEVEKFPEISFKSSKVEKGKDAGTLKVSGNLVMHGVTKPLTVDCTGPSPEFKDPGGNAHVAFSCSTKISRKEWGVTGSESVVSDDIVIELEVELKNKK